MNHRIGRFGFLLALCVLSLAIGPSAWAAPKLTVSAGYAGFFRPGEWTPINVLIENASDASEKAYTVLGTLRVTSQPWKGDPTIYERTVEVTQTQRKQFTVYAKISDSRNCQIEFFDSKGKSVWGPQDLKTDLTELKAGQKLIVVASDQGKFFGAKSSLPMRGVRYAHVLSSSLPDRWYGYESVDLLVFPQDPGNNLQEPASEALSTWIKIGGRIVAMGGIHFQSFRNGALESLLPVDIGEGEDISLVNGEGVSVSVLAPQFKMRPGARAMSPGAARPLAARWGRGRGEVVYCGVDLDTPVAGSVPALQMLWDALVYSPWPRPAGPVAQQLVTSPSPTDFGFGRAARLPPILIVFLLLGVYTVLVGPVNLYYLRKRRRMELAWITIPVIVLIFSAMAYTLGFLAKGGLLIVREIETLEGAAGQSLVRSDKMAALFSPKKRTYDLESGTKGGALCSLALWTENEGGGVGLLSMPPPQGMLRGGRGPAAPLAMGPIAEAGWPILLDESNDSMRAPDRLVAQWSAQNFSTTGAAELPGVIDAQAQLSGATLRVRVHNGLKVPLRGVTLAAAGRGARVGDMAPGEEREVQLVLFGSAEARDSNSTLFWAALENAAPEEIARLGTADNIPQEQEDDDAIVARFLSARLWREYARTRNTSGSDLNTVRPKLLAWLDQSPSPFGLNEKPDRYAYAGLISLTIPMSVSQGESSIPGFASVAQLVDLDVKEMGAYRNTGDEGPEISDAAAVFAVSPGVPGLPFKVESASLELQCAGGAGHIVEASAYNFQSHRWDVLGRDGDNYFGREPGEFTLEHLNPVDSTAFLRIESAHTQGWTINQAAARIQKIEIGYKGTVQ